MLLEGRNSLPKDCAAGLSKTSASGLWFGNSMVDLGAIRCTVFLPFFVQGYAKALQLQLWKNQTSNLGASTTTTALSPFSEQNLFIVETMTGSGHLGSITL